MKTPTLVFLLTLIPTNIEATIPTQSILNNSLWMTHADITNFSEAIRQDGSRQNSYEIGSLNPKYYGFTVDVPKQYDDSKGTKSSRDYLLNFEENMRLWGSTINNFTYLDSTPNSQGSRSRSEGLITGLHSLNIDENAWGLTFSQTNSKTKLNQSSLAIDQTSDTVGTYYRSIGEFVVFARFEQQFNICYGKTENKLTGASLPNWDSQSLLIEWRNIVHMVNAPTNGNMGCFSLNYENTHVNAPHAPNVFNSDYEALKLEVWHGGNIEYFHQFRLSGSLGYSWDIIRLQTPNSGPSPGYNAFFLNIANTYTFADNFDLSIGYYFEVRKRYQTQSLRFGLHHHF